ncbi:hypothetical protein DFJ63DRAFT_314244 [Scheffersomyces coipomensis]|uniref:uncharacterized protein n=1 Tax=Scheffersomyces coipomensis TaxID=1788519 RepID=UPI00315CD477
MLTELINLIYAKDFIEKLFAGYSFDISQQTNVVKNYYASVELILFLINQDTFEVRKCIDQINNILDPLNIINDRTKVVLILNRFVRFDVFEPLDFNARELNITIRNFLNYVELKNIKYENNHMKTITAAFYVMINFSLSPQNLSMETHQLQHSNVTACDHNNTNCFPNNSILQLNWVSDSNISKLNKYDLGRDHIYHHFGLFQPVIYEMEQPSFSIVFNKEKYDLLDYEFKEDLVINEIFAYPTVNKNILRRISKYLSQLFTCKLERIPNEFQFEYDTNEYNMRLDRIISSSDKKSIPIRHYNGLTLAYKIFTELKSNNFSVEVKRLPFIYQFTQVFIETIACNSLCGFLTDGKMVLYIKINPDLNCMGKCSNYWENRMVPCQIFEVQSNKDFINCVIDAAIDSRDATFQTKILELRSAPSILEYYYCLLQQFLLSLTEKLFKSKFNRISIRTNRDDEISTFVKLYFNRKLRININEVVPIRYFNLIKRIRLYYGNKFIVQTLQNALKPFKILEAFGQNASFRHSSVVLKLASNDGRQYILKIYDPIFSESMIKYNFSFNISVQDSMASFISECCAYYILRKQSFVPKVFKVGLLTSETNSVMKQFDIDNMNLKGFYILMEYIDAQHITQESYNKMDIWQKLKVMHNLGISHGDMCCNNILVKDKGKNNLLLKHPKFYFIDFAKCKISNAKRNMKVSSRTEDYELSVKTDLEILNQIGFVSF